MRKSSALDALMPRTRQLILAATLLTPARWWYLSVLAQHLGVRPSSLQRELSALVEAGILARRRDGKRIYYRPDPACPFLSELQGLLTKTAGLGDVLKEALQPFSETIDVAFVYGPVARNQYTSESDVELVIIGTVRLAELSTALPESERRIQRVINPVLYTWEEFSRKLSEGNHLLSAVRSGEKLLLQGDETELAAALQREASPTAEDESPGAEQLKTAGPRG